MDLFRVIRELRLDDDPGPVQILEETVFAWASPAEIAVCAAAELIGILAFGLRNWPEAIPDVGLRAIRWLDLLSGQLGAA